MKDYIPELSELRMVNRAPNRPVDFGNDSAYIFACLRDIERGFGLAPFAGMADGQIPAKALIRQFIIWWRTLEPGDDAQRDAHGRLPGAIRLIDTFCSWLEERGAL